MAKTASRVDGVSLGVTLKRFTARYTVAFQRNVLRRGEVRFSLLPRTPSSSKEGRSALPGLSRMARSARC